MEGLSSKTSSPDGPPADQETQTVAGLAPPSPSLPPASTNSGTPHPGLVASPPAATAAMSSAPPAHASSPSSRNIDHGSATCALPSPSGTHQEPVRTTTSAPSATSAPVAPSPPSPPALHPDVAAFLQHVTMMQAARVRPAGTAPTGTNSPRPAPVQRSPTAAPTTSAPVSTSFHTDCANPTCVAASRRIHDVRVVQDTFARINANYSTNYGIVEPIRAAWNAAYSVLIDCEYRTIMARVESVTTLLRQVNGQPTLNNQDILIHLLRRTGMQISNTPRAAPGPAATGTPSVQGGGGPMPAGAATPAPVHTPAPAHTPTAVPHTPAV